MSLKTLLLVLVFIAGCCALKLPGFVTVNAEEDLLSNLDANERAQDPAFMELPNDGGYFIGYKFSQALTERQLAYMLQIVLESAHAAGEKVEGRVFIFGYDCPTKSASATADFASGEVELWETPNREDYTKKVCKTDDVEGVVGYLVKGYSGNCSTETGKIIEEMRRQPGRKTTL